LGEMAALRPVKRLKLYGVATDRILGLPDGQPFYVVSIMEFEGGEVVRETQGMRRRSLITARCRIHPNPARADSS
jgi:hypothetical protein